MANFEQCSHEFLRKSAENSYLHADWSTVFGSAGALLKSVLEMVAMHDAVASQKMSSDEAYVRAPTPRLARRGARRYKLFNVRV